jgi:23S rRNA (adenine2503-C2)-methyltransferase
MNELRSQLDSSINFVEKHLEGFIETRYVRRANDYFNCYLSSQSGCNKGCRFCHLTATGQTKSDDIDLEGFMEQAVAVFSHYEKEAQPAKKVHYSFMARGEPLANKFMLEEGDEILRSLAVYADHHNLYPKFNISTIMPKTLDKPLSAVFRLMQPTIYYSIYSVNPEFRKRWIPAAMDANDALIRLREYQEASKKIVKLHFAFIKGQNDSDEDVGKLCEAVARQKLMVEFNIVRYNPFSPEQGIESDEETVQHNAEAIRIALECPVKVIQRVGFDVKASCGMFVR